MILDSNILIYAFQPSTYFLKQYLNDKNYVSGITKLEVLGFHSLGNNDKIKFEVCFDNMNVIDIDGLIIERAILLRQTKKMSLGDAIIAATALINHLTLVTRNEKDYQHIPGIKLLNPFPATSF